MMISLILFQGHLMTSQEYLLQVLQGENLGSAPESSLRLQEIYTFIHKAHCILAYDMAYSTYWAEIQLFFASSRECHCH